MIYKHTNKTSKHGSPSDRFVLLARMGEVVFHARDAAQIWDIKNPRTLNMTLSRYVNRGLIHRIYKGFYSLKPIDKLPPYLLGLKAMNGQAYVSCESILFDEGIINQLPQEITLVGRSSGRFSIGGRRFHSRQLQDRFLSNDVGIVDKDKNGVYTATVARAVADTLYFNPRKHFDGPVDWKAVEDIAHDIGYNMSIPK